jgi:hypothetical protein
MCYSLVIAQTKELKMSGRWERLADTLTEAGIPAKVDAFGESRKIFVRGGSVLVVVHDTWWRKNLDVWTGWEVYTEDAEGITLQTYPRTKKRGDVLRNVQSAISN